MIYFTLVNLLVVIVLILYMIIYFTTRPLSVNVFLYPTLISRLILLIIYSVSVYSLQKKFGQFNSDYVKQERRSIMTQFVAFLISAVISVGYLCSQLTEKEANF